MTDSQENCAENFDLKEILFKGENFSFTERMTFFSNFLKEQVNQKHYFYMRETNSAADREVEINDLYSGKQRKFLMFGSNNYLGLANHPHIREKVKECINKYGVGIGGPPLLNGYTRLCRSLEERLAAMKKKEDTIIFSSGYSANIGIITSLVNKHDLILYDELSHASLVDGLTIHRKKSLRFRHNDAENLSQLLQKYGNQPHRDVFVSVEGVYSMDGDIARLDKIVPICKRHHTILILDDAHGTGVMGKKGHGTAEHFDVDDCIDVAMGTFSKAFAVTGGFVCASKPLIDYLRFFARSYMFSAALSPMVLAAVDAALDVIEREPHRRKQLSDNIQYLTQKLNTIGFNIHPLSPIFVLPVPDYMEIRKAAYQFHQRGIFLNAVEYPAVPRHLQRFRISLMSDHTQEDMDRLITAIEEVWASFKDKR
jgi:glycine C-acetyltransferase